MQNGGKGGNQLFCYIVSEAHDQLVHVVLTGVYCYHQNDGWPVYWPVAKLPKTNVVFNTSKLIGLSVAGKLSIFDDRDFWQISRQFQHARTSFNHRIQRINFPSWSKVISDSNIVVITHTRLCRTHVSVPTESRFEYRHAESRHWCFVYVIWQFRHS